MVREAICLYDTDRLYGRIIVQALQEESICTGNCACFDSLEAVVGYLQETPVSIFLLQQEKEEELYTQLEKEGWQEVQIEKLKKKTVLLTEDREEEREQSIYKYLPKKEFISQMKTALLRQTEKTKKKPLQKNRENTQKITGYISFGSNHILQYPDMWLQEGFGQKALVVNFEQLAMTLPHEKASHNLSDLIYLATIDRISRADIGEYVYSVGDLDYIEPMDHYSDGYELDARIMEELIHYFGSLPYRRILLISDVSHRGLARMLEMCHEVRLEQPDSLLSHQKRELFVKMLKLEQKEKLLDSHIGWNSVNLILECPPG